MRLLKSLLFILLLIVTAPVIILLAWVATKVEESQPQKTNKTKRQEKKIPFKSRLDRIFPISGDIIKTLKQKL